MAAIAVSDTVSEAGASVPSNLALTPVRTKAAKSSEAVAGDLGDQPPRYRRLAEPALPVRVSNQFRGHTNKSTAKSLGLSVNKVGTHLQSIYANLGVQSRVQLTTRCASAALALVEILIDAPLWWFTVTRQWGLPPRDRRLAGSGAPP